MNITTSFDRNYMKYAIVMLSSFCANNEGSHKVFIMHRLLTQEDINFIKDSLSKYDLKIYSLKMDFSDIEPMIPVTPYWTYETYCTLKLADTLPDDIERILYFDTDMIINKSIDELWNMDFAGNDIIAADESNGSCRYENIQCGQKVIFEEYKDKFRYFNTGTMLLNISKIKREYSYKKYYDIMEKWKFDLPACEQDILNYAHFGRVKYIPWSKYNLFARDGCRDGYSYDRVINGDETSIVHFVGMKPWNSMGLHYDLEKLWWDYAKITPIYKELMEEFVEDTLTNKNIENTLRNLDSENKQLKEAVRKTTELLQKITS
ncbi:Lipopolysaccharide biosynthesis protein, LPS:glycosyltransferase [Butyrivibrio sp. INlla18]|uniref:glycosyltransferase family 8 protein n=1 Tax=Butyrivibrio sp. INlla18 TaxID=1520806 RepID=UPI0008828B55|nr:glycosyltransferase [Butyrivibrio sp. INlla18]SDA41912.1 Lipopolysaccharide biosynthesis protein, LPS:glycosyltransferase [Butyrivibrio sp. INlla18]